MDKEYIHGQMETNSLDNSIKETSMARESEFSEMDQKEKVLSKMIKKTEISYIH